MRASRIHKGFALIELIVIIVIIVVIGILAGVAIPRYFNLTRNASDGTAKGVLGALRTQNSLMFSQHILGRTTASYTMFDIARNMAALSGISWTGAATRFTMTIRGNIYRFTLTPTPRPPTTSGSITAGAGTFTRW